jgi:hypothetical protein
MARGVLEGRGIRVTSEVYGSWAGGGQGKPLIAFEGLRRGASEVFGWID